MDQALVVLVTASSVDEARQIARGLLESRLAACVNVVPVESLFRWEGALQQETEALMIIKTRAGVFDRLAQAIKAAHSYDVPEIIALPIAAGSAEYLKWIEDEVTP